MEWSIGLGVPFQPVSGKRANGEGWIYPYKGGYAGHVWVTTPDGQRRREYVYGKTWQETHAAWVELKAKAGKQPIAVKVPMVAEYLAGPSRSSGSAPSSAP